MHAMRISEAASVIGVSAATLHRWAKRGLIPFLLLPSGQRRFRQTDLAEMLRPRRGRPPKREAQTAESEEGPG